MPLIFTIAKLWRFREVARSLLTKNTQRELSAERLLLAIKAEVANSEISTVTEVRDLLRACGFKFGNLHTNHYYDIGKRYDVVYHRSLFAPFLQSLKKSSRVWVIHADASFAHENDHSARGWFSLDEENDDLIPAGAGVGRRLNMYEFATEDGLLWHPDGTTPFTPPRATY